MLPSPWKPFLIFFVSISLSSYLFSIPSSLYCFTTSPHSLFLLSTHSLSFLPPRLRCKREVIICTLSYSLDTLSSHDAAVVVPREIGNYFPSLLFICAFLAFFFMSPLAVSLPHLSLFRMHGRGSLHSLLSYPAPSTSTSTIVILCISRRSNSVNCVNHLIDVHDGKEPHMLYLVNNCE